MADAYPSTSFAKYTLTSNQPVLRSSNDSGKESSRKVSGHLHSFNISHPVMSAADFGIIDGFLSDKDYVSFTIVLPDREPQGVATGTPLVNGALAKGVSSIVTDGWTISQTGIMKAGDILVFAGHTHVYTVLVDTNSDVSGNSTLSIAPDLKEAVANNEAITVNSVPFTVRLDKPHQPKVAPPVLYDFNFNVTEVA